jgi:hypothetical protein
MPDVCGSASESRKRFFLFEHRQLVQSRPIALRDNVFLLKQFDERCDRLGKNLQRLARDDVINE